MDTKHDRKSLFSRLDAVDIAAFAFIGVIWVYNFYMLAIIVEKILN